METVLKEAMPLEDYKLKLTFQNGSTALVNMARRVKTMRFSVIGDPELFATAQAQSDKVVWTDGRTEFSVYCNELLDTMMMD